MRKTILSALCGLAAVTVARADLIGSQLSLTLDSADITGAPGETVGWGFTLANNSSEWIVIDSTTFALPTFNGLLGGETNGYGIHVYDPLTNPNGYAFGTYADFAAANFVYLGPSQSLHQSFDNLLQTGVGSFTINSGAIPGGTDSVNPTLLSSGQTPGSAIGAILMSYFVTTVDVMSPSFDPYTDLDQNPQFDRFLTAPASVTVVPEPVENALLGLGLCALAAFKKFRRTVTK